MAIGILYGEGDFKKTVEIACRCGQDSDCNPSSAGGIIGAMLGYDKLPRDWREALDKIKGRKFSFTNYSFDSICASTLKRAEQNVINGGGTVARRKSDDRDAETRPRHPRSLAW